MVLSRFAAFLDPGGVLAPKEITRAHVNAYADSIGDRSEHYRADTLRMLKAFFGRLAATGRLLLNPASHLRLPRLKFQPVVPLSERDMRRLLDAPDTDTVCGLRDRAMLEVLYATGMRSGELRLLKLQDVDLSERQCFIQKGKGSKGRWVPLTEEACRFTAAYLEASRPRLVGTRPTPYLFPNRRGGRMSAVGLGERCHHYARQAGLPRPVWPHLLRHTAACHLLEGGASLFHIQKLLGHVNATTTQRYTHMSAGHLKDVLKACHPRP